MSWTYKTDTGLYDVTKLNDESKVAFQYLAEVESELQVIGKRADVLRAAASVFHKTIQDNLTDEAIVPEEEDNGGE